MPRKSIEQKLFFTVYNDRVLEIKQSPQVFALGLTISKIKRSDYLVQSNKDACYKPWTRKDFYKTYQVMET